MWKVAVVGNLFTLYSHGKATAVETFKRKEAVPMGY
jgi:hypothetical protein